MAELLISMGCLSNQRLNILKAIMPMSMGNWPRVALGLSPKKRLEIFCAAHRLYIWPTPTRRTCRIHRTSRETIGGICRQRVYSRKSMLATLPSAPLLGNRGKAVRCASNSHCPYIAAHLIQTSQNALLTSMASGIRASSKLKISA